MSTRPPIDPVRSSQSPKSPSAGTQRTQPDSNSATRVQTAPSSQPPHHEAEPTDDNTDDPSGTAVPVTNKEATFQAIISQVNEEETTPEGWVRGVGTRIWSRFPKRMPNGWWRRIQEEYNDKHQANLSLTEVKNAFTREKARMTVRAAEGGDEEAQLPAIIANAALYKKIRDSLKVNIEAVPGRGLRDRTKKIYSHEANYEVIELLNTAIEREGVADKVADLKTLNDVYYACQLTYQEVTKKPKKESNWKESIEKKINKLDGQVEMVARYNKEEPPSRELVELCKAKGLHTNNHEQVMMLRDQLEETRDAYKKKVDISDKRIQFKRTNMMFEFNRATFYRRLGGEVNEIDENIDLEEVTDFWRQMWTADEDVTQHEEMLELLDPVTLQADTSRERIAVEVERQVRFLANWKTPGPDQVYNFFIKRLNSLHKKLAQLICDAVERPELIDEELYTGVTYLLPKVEKATKGAELRPITCLPNLYKLASKVVTAILRDSLEINGVISVNQLGTKRGCQGAKQQALINKVLNKAYDNQLCTSWIDVKKAYDSVRHDYLLDVLQKLEVPNNITEFVKRMLEHQKTNINCAREVIAQVKIEKGLLQGDALSPLLFVTALEPLSRKLNRNCEKVQVGQIERNHLIFIDDIKLLAETEESLVELCHYTADCLNQMGLQINAAKSARNVDSDEAFGDKLEGENGYKYLGVLEDSENVIKPENKRLLKQRVKERVTRLCETKLNAVNLFRGLNEFALSTMNYYLGLLPYETKELEDIDKEVRRILGEYKVTRNASNIDRLYLKRNNLGRGLANVEEKAELMLLKLYDYLDRNPDTRPLVESEREEATCLGLIREYIKAKYNIEEDAQVTEKEVKKRQEERRMERIKSKRMHSLLFTDDDFVYDLTNSSMWLMKGNITPQHEGMLCKLQDRNLYFGSQTKCPHCKVKKMSVEHLATQCGRLLSFDYKKRHDEVVRCLHFQFTKMYGLNKSKRLKNYKVQNVICNERVKIKSDVPVTTELRIEHNKPDLMIHDLKRKEIILVEVGITSKHILATTETTKGRKYELLAQELKCIHPGTTVTQIPVVMTWDGLVTKHFKRHMKQLQVSNRLQAYIQSVVLKRTCESILVDCRRNYNGEWHDDEVPELMDQLDTGPAGADPQEM